MNSDQLTLHRRLLIVLKAFCPTLDQSNMQGHADFYPRILARIRSEPIHMLCNRSTHQSHTLHTEIYMCQRKTNSTTRYPFTTRVEARFSPPSKSIAICDLLPPFGPVHRRGVPEEREF